MRAIVVDSGEAKKNLSIKMGAEEFVDFKEHKDVAARIKEIADGVGAHGVLVTAYQSYKGMPSPPSMPTPNHSIPPRPFN